MEFRRVEQLSKISFAGVARGGGGCWFAARAFAAKNQIPRGCSLYGEDERQEAGAGGRMEDGLETSWTSSPVCTGEEREIERRTRGAD